MSSSWKTNLKSNQIKSTSHHQIHRHIHIHIHLSSSNSVNFSSEWYSHYQQNVTTKHWQQQQHQPPSSPTINSNVWNDVQVFCASTSSRKKSMLIILINVEKNTINNNGVIKERKSFYFLKFQKWRSNNNISSWTTNQHTHTHTPAHNNIWHNW